MRTIAEHLIDVKPFETHSAAQESLRLRTFQAGLFSLKSRHRFGVVFSILRHSHAQRALSPIIP
jgi:hypothetical protein